MQKTRITIRDVARALQCSPRNVRLMLVAGKLPGIASRPHSTAHWRFNPSALRVVATFTNRA